MNELLTPRSNEAIAELQKRAVQSTPISDGGNLWGQDYRAPGEHDRDRVLYCSAFRRLAYVTQVTAPEAGHAFHNRLIHSLKVAQVGRRNAERLREIAAQDGISGQAKATVLSLDPGAVEASCLAHDLGHPPFGHIAEDQLNMVAKEYVQDDGVFEGNAQSFRIVTRLAQRSGGSGLNLTRQTLDGILKYPWRWWREDPLEPGRRERKWGYYKDDAVAYAFAREFSETPDDEDHLPERSLEALIMEWADDLTYAVHDVDDFFRARLIPLHRLGDPTDDEFKRLEELLEDARRADFTSWPRGYAVDDLLGSIEAVAGAFAPAGDYRHGRDDRRLMRRLDSDLITRYMSAFRVEDVPTTGAMRVFVDPDIVREVEALKMLVRVYVIRRPGLAVVQHGQQRVVRELFSAYYKASGEGKDGDRRIFPPGPKRTLDEGGNDSAHRARVVVDLIAGLTEETAVELHRRLYGDGAAATLDATAHMA
ncbi:MAG TPA: dNTP triphosphohydrolase [Solirubrobacteraceae bacterium]|nr:dNTP triphosphohydrolase [Solirubrobacteraceae bacterium]